MRKLRILLAEVIGLGLLIGWLMWKYPELVDDIIPWVALLIAWHFTWEFVLDTRPVRGATIALGKRVNRMLIWPLVFLIGGGVSLLYWVGISKSLNRLASIAKQKAALPPVATPVLQPSAPEPAPLPNAHSGKKGPKAAPSVPSPSLTLNTYLQPDEPYAEGTLLAGIVWDKRYVDVRLDVNNGAAAIQNLDFLVGLDTSIAGVGQISQIPGVTAFPAESPPPTWLQGTDLQGNPVSVPIMPAPGMASIGPVYRVQCSNIFANTTLHFVVASVVLNAPENGQPPKQLFGMRRPPRMIRVKGKYETRTGGTAQNHDVDFSYEFARQ